MAGVSSHIGKSLVNLAPASACLHQRVVGGWSKTARARRQQIVSAMQHLVRMPLAENKVGAAGMSV